MTIGVVNVRVCFVILALCESAIGAALISGRFLRGALVLLFIHMAGTLMPLILFPSRTFDEVPFVPTMEGQYILKNLVLISAAVVIGGRFGSAKRASPHATAGLLTPRAPLASRGSKSTPVSA